MPGPLSPEQKARRPQYRRRYDWELAAAMLDDGQPKAAVARALGVTTGALDRLELTDAEAYLKQRSAAERRKVLCPHCRVRKKTRAAMSCQVCYPFVVSRRLRVIGPDEQGLYWPYLRCVWCKRSKPMRMFPRSRDDTWGRHSCCRECNTVLRRAYRNRTKVPCDICGRLRLSDAEKRPNGHLRSWPFCAECLYRSKDPRAVSARAEIRRLQAA